MRLPAPLLAFAALIGCEDDGPLFAADCRDGSRITGARDVVESRCARRGGIRALAPLQDQAGDRPAGNAG